MSNPVKGTPIEVVALGDGVYRVSDATHSRLAFAVAARDTWVFLDGRTYVVTAQGATRPVRVDQVNALSAPMPATVVKIDVAPGDVVKQDQVLIVLEAMKMELPIKAPRDGRVTTINCQAGQLVQPGVPLVDLEA